MLPRVCAHDNGIAGLCRHTGDERVHPLVEQPHVGWHRCGVGVGASDAAEAAVVDDSVLELVRDGREPVREAGAAAAAAAVQIHHRKVRRLEQLVASWVAQPSIAAVEAAARRKVTPEGDRT